MAIDTPARIAILGAGPIGLEAALYARYLGYDVDLYERGRVAEHVRRWGHVRMFTPFGENCSPLALAALKAQDPDWTAPCDDDFLTGQEFARRYLLPLAASDLLVDSLHEQTEVVALGREGWLKSEGAGSEDRADSNFRLLLRTTDAHGHRHERYAEAEAVIDTTGTYGSANWLGPDGLPALGEQAARPHIEYGLPDVLGTGRDRYAGRNVLLVGDGDSAVTALVALADLAAQTGDTWITWVTRPTVGEGTSPAARSAECQRLHERARHLAADDSNHVTYWPATAVEAVTWHADRDRFSVRLTGKHPGEQEFDRLVALVGYRADLTLLDGLQVDIAGAAGTARVRERLTSEPDFYVLGAKSWTGDFRLTLGLEQIRQTFALLGDRESLNLYATVGKLA